MLCRYIISDLNNALSFCEDSNYHNGCYANTCYDILYVAELLICYV